MGKLGNWGETYRPTPSSRGRKAAKFEHIKGVEDEHVVHCKLCGFYVDKDRDFKCPFCDSEMYDK